VECTYGYCRLHPEVLYVYVCTVDEMFVFRASAHMPFAKPVSGNSRAHARGCIG